MRRMRLSLVLPLLAIVVTGCASPLPRPGGPGIGTPDRAPPAAGERDAPASDGSAGVETPSNARSPRANAASTALLDDSRRSRAAGDFSAAAISVERALSIDPNNAALWIELAEIRLAEGNRDQADSFARKALTLAGNDASITARAERLVSR